MHVNLKKARLWPVKLQMSRSAIAALTMMIINEMPYTPATSASCIIGRYRYWVCPVKNHGKPDIRKDRMNSDAVQIHGITMTIGSFKFDVISRAQNANMRKYAAQYKLSNIQAIKVT
ncbi:hypothetical protein BPIT_00260 [Candidatus Brocadia pituitae]|nr:hypothetical protein BPIT_00260 [Candidatus Brocadia pituitae]